jgi:hypothetical protein
MNKKNAISAFFTLAMMLALLVGTWQSAAAQDATPSAPSTSNAQTAIEFGRQGVFIPAGFSSNNVTVEKVERSDLSAFTPVKFIRPLLRLKFTTDAGSTNNTPFVLTNVFYNLVSFERAAWDRGELSIYYRDVNDSTWKKCNTFLVDDSPVATSEDETPGVRGSSGGRVACAVPQFTLVGLGSTTGID